MARDVAGTRAPGEPPGFRATANYRVEPMAGTFEVVPTHVARLVDAVLTGGLSLEDLGTIVFCLEAYSERWLWDTDTPEGERVANALFWLGAPEINFPLTPAVLSKIRRYLVEGENTLTEADLGQRG